MKKIEVQNIVTLKNNNNIIIEKADKGGNTVILNKDDYIQGVTQLHNIDYYEVLDGNQTQIHNGKCTPKDQNTGTQNTKLHKGHHPCA